MIIYHSEYLKQEKKTNKVQAHIQKMMQGSKKGYKAK